MPILAYVPSPPPPEPLSEKLSTSVTVTEYRTVKATANTAGISMAELLRRALRAYL